MNSLYCCTILEQIRIKTQWLLLESATLNNRIILHECTLYTSFCSNKIRNVQVKGYLISTCHVTKFCDNMAFVKIHYKNVISAASHSFIWCEFSSSLKYYSTPRSFRTSLRCWRLSLKIHGGLTKSETLQDRQR